MITTITGTIKNPLGIPLKNIRVRFSLVESGFGSATVYPKGYTVEAVTDTSGQFSISVWNNTDSGARYEITFSEQGNTIDSFLAFIPIKSTVTIDEVRTYSGLTSVAPAVIYQDVSTALTVLNQRLDSIGTGGSSFDPTLYFTKTESNNLYPLKTSVDGRYYLKTESDARYSLKGESISQFGVITSYFKVTAGQTVFILSTTNAVVSVSVNGYDMDTSLYSVSSNSLTFTGLEVNDSVQVIQQGEKAGIVKQEFVSADVGTNIFTLAETGNVYSVTVDGFTIEPSEYSASPTTLVVYNLEANSRVITLRTRAI